MLTRYWLQYHNYDKHGTPGKFVIHTNKESCKDITENVDIIYLMVGATCNENLADDFIGLNDSKVANHFVGNRVYFLFEKFTVINVDFIGQRQFGGDDYEITGSEKSGEILVPILLSSPEFCKFWNSYQRHGLVCLSELGYKFPELEQTKENFQYRKPLPHSTEKREQAESSKIVVVLEIYQGIKFLQKNRPVRYLENIPEVVTQLKRFGFKATAQWIKSNPKQYLIGLSNGFKPQD